MALISGKKISKDLSKNQKLSFVAFIERGPVDQISPDQKCFFSLDRKFCFH
jgi:hypothetical protein